MSKATKRKHVTKEVLDDFILPEDGQQIVKVTAGKGNNLHEVESQNQDKFLVSMPTKFRKNVWIKRGDFVLVQPIEEGDKVKAEIVTILYKEQIKYIKSEGLWPAVFESEETKSNSMISDDLLPPSDDSDEDNTCDSVMNINRKQVAVYDESDESDDEDG
ncbi:probable RNA-binding protein EIF1AD [Mizuhopecten yessoensis]|uniref:Probable RNA-binding protein EIF1AD n=1 Tax=Mizuhopecten yessoensis TaxID=6573 RepID=A0A210PJE6_MIZYE|nr:probable RNA-binding protein EIF1AD [Mizuhopecten yessoensis]OWF36609.1 RNA-binding protein EIF1AD [Mizuhopecten yessoensis]